MPFATLADVSTQPLLVVHNSNKLDAVADLIKLFEDAFKQQPDNDELGRQAFFANVRAGNWKTAQLVRFFYTLITDLATTPFHHYHFTYTLSRAAVLS
jgi:hypothetical protein